MSAQYTRGTLINTICIGIGIGPTHDTPTLRADTILHGRTITDDQIPVEGDNALIVG